MPATRVRRHACRAGGAAAAIAAVPTLTARSGDPDAAAPATSVTPSPAVTPTAQPSSATSAKPRPTTRPSSPARHGPAKDGDIDGDGRTDHVTVTPGSDPTSWR